MDKATELQITPVDSDIKLDGLSVDGAETTPVDRKQNGTEKPQKSKRKITASVDELSVIDDTDAFTQEYAIVQNENKRQKIEITRSNKENNANAPNEKKPTTPSAKPKEVKSTETNKLRAKYENIHANTVQKLNAQAEQLRMEISTLKAALANEQNAVRTLR